MLAEEDVHSFTHEDRPTIGGIRLGAAGLVALANRKTIARRTALIGSASFLDVLLLSPGIHCQQEAAEINGGEYPLTGAMHSAAGWIFRIEIPATFRVEGSFGLFGELLRIEFWASILFLIGITASIVAIVLLVAVFRDWWALGVLGMLMLARVLNACVIKLRHDKYGFKGKKEGNSPCDFLIILSQDRWVRMRGGVDDIKEVAAGLREPGTLESFAVTFAKMPVYCSAALAGNTTTAGSLLLACLLLFSAGILGLSNAAMHSLHMLGRIVSVEGKPVRYEHRLSMVRDMIQETKHTEWTLRMSMITESEVVELKRAIERGRCNDDTRVHVTYCSF
ncbi:uncharacterized protein PHACADRAFT_194016 [Phanerochaete carnosa HHB-10118-sp]|uniref:Uncharacterized protein n=1 Tax=Phanerochaete carnosa (strain HHB-10118-sp) TaxID=650164 RepID=K5X0Y1_PHACS|nr:uncharacterized protein PHACADRAFT_194016 [Phanerochaete carnosa HHB-10118-sp]EKM56397.1 hypothetical protein PHACADRAFT_194016 [Phanerochaete carnosa HHB-10118-sp]